MGGFRRTWAGRSLARTVVVSALLALLPADARSPEAPVTPSAAGASREQANEALLAALSSAGSSPAEIEALRAIFARSPVIGQGNPAVTRHPMTREQCRAREAAAGVDFVDPEAERICGAPRMAPLYDPATQARGDATACVDQLEFPNLPCEYPVVWVRAAEAAELCEAQGKRLCDAHEWEGACAGALGPADYPFGAGGRSDVERVSAMRSVHNARYSPTQSWSYGPSAQKGICASDSTKTEGCNGGQYSTCGSNTYPAGAFPECRSALGVYDENGNAAEHMNLPLEPGQMASTGSQTLGVTEMKGSWFIFDRYQAHPDWCRWRAPYWHGSRVRDAESHRNYHLGFRCCRDVEGG